MSEVLTFVDASHLITKANLWEERYKAIEEKYEKLNNKTLPNLSTALYITPVAYKGHAFILAPKSLKVNLPC